MIGKEKTSYHFPIKRAIIWYSFLLAVFIIGVYFLNKRVNSYNYLDYYKQMDTTYVVNPVNDRGGLFYDNYEFVVSSKSKLVENEQGYSNWNFYSKTNSSSHSLSHLPGPYYMYKAAYNDTIVVIKDGYVLKFKMPTPDTVSRKDRFWRD